MKITDLNIILMAILLIAAPLMFIWHTELFMLALQIGIEGEFTNGWIKHNPIQIYHLYMYVLVFVNGLGTVMLLKLYMRSNNEEKYKKSIN